jgi:short-subunit dehydrogenase
MKACATRIVFTGATGGIGQAACNLLNRSGACLMLVGRSPARLSALARSLAREEAGSKDRIQWHACDLTSADGVDELAAVARDWRSNVLVHGAGLPAFGRLESIDADVMLRVVAANLIAPMMLTRAFLPYLRTLDKAQVLCIGSALGRIGLPGFSVYSATKFGLRGFAEALRRELRDSGVRVQYLGPRSTRTSFNGAAVEAYNDATGTAMDSAELVARAILSAIEDEAAERFLGMPEALAVRINGAMPGLLDGAFSRHRATLPKPPTFQGEAVASRRDPANEFLDIAH